MGTVGNYTVACFGGRAVHFHGFLLLSNYVNNMLVLTLMQMVIVVYWRSLVTVSFVLNTAVSCVLQLAVRLLTAKV